MLPVIIWIGGIALEGMLLIRGWKVRHTSRFPIFFSYLGLIFTQSVLLYFVARFYNAAYSSTYWTLELLDVFAGCGVVFEIYRIALADFPGVKRVARSALLFVFSLTIGRVLVTAQEGFHRWSARMTVQLERDMRFVEIAAVMTLLILVFSYRIPLGRNLRGIVLGYGIFLGVSILNLTLMWRFGSEVRSIASSIQSLSYLAVLCLWVAFLWSYYPRPVSKRSADNHARTYEELYAETNNRLGKAREEVKGALHLP
jgi:hypothetical protein